LAHLLHFVSMKIAIPQWHSRVSPVFDTAGAFVLLELEDGREVRRERNAFPPGDAYTRIKTLRQFGADVLICGAVSGPLKRALIAAGIDVIPFICGEVRDVVEAYLCNGLDERYLQPGYKKISESDRYRRE